MSVLLSALRSRPLAAGFIAGLLWLAVLGVRASGLLESLEIEAYDRFVRWRAGDSASGRIALIQINEADLNRWGYPLSDELLARAIRQIAQREPRAIGVDIYRDQEVPPGSEALEALIRGDPRVVVIFRFGTREAGGIPPPPFLAGTSQIAFSDQVVDPGGIVRRGLLFLWEGDAPAFSLPLRLALLHLAREGITLESDPEDPYRLRFGKATLERFRADDGGYVAADDRGYQFLLDYRAGPGAFPSFSLSDLLDGRVDGNVFRDRVVLVGNASPSVKDFFFTPFSDAESDDQALSGSEIQAHAVSQLLRCALDGEVLLSSLSGRAEAGWTLLWSLLGAVLGLTIRSPSGLAALVLAGLAALGIAGYGAFLGDWWIPVVPPALAWAGSAGVGVALVSKRERAERSLIMTLFAQHVSKDVADAIWAERDQFMHEGRLRSRRVYLTTLFSDLKGYTTASERLDPEVLMDWINQYMAAMARLVEEHGGVVDDYAGDGIKANFGVPVPRTSEEELDADAVHAVGCALAMSKAVDALNKRWGADDLPAVRMRIGIASGPAVVGSIGSAQRMAYKSLGDTINTAARLESFDKEGFQANPDATSRILISGETFARLDGRFPTREFGEHRLRGKHREIAVYQVLESTGSPLRGTGEEDQP